MQPNNQPPVARSRETTHLRIHEIFNTIQGEGPYAGVPAVFVRVSGCSIQCPGCDTIYTGVDKRMVPIEILNAVQDAHKGKTSTLVVITGGEPFLYAALPMLCELLHFAGYDVQIETNGTLFQPIPSSAMVVCSPKTGKVHEKLLPFIAAYKYVGEAGNLLADGLPATALGYPARPYLARPPENYLGDVFLQPIDVQDPVENKKHLDAIVASCVQHGHRLCLQTHKIIGVP